MHIMDTLASFWLAWNRDSYSTSRYLTYAAGRVDMLSGKDGD